MIAEFEDTQSDTFDAPDPFNANATTETHWGHGNEAEGRIDESHSLSIQRPTYSIRLTAADPQRPTD